MKIHHTTNHQSSSISSSNKKLYLCQTCGKSCRSTSELQIHIRSHLPIDIKNKFKCDICFKKFGTKPNLTAHKRIHDGNSNIMVFIVNFLWNFLVLGVREYVCEQCGKSFIQKGNLDNHMLIHVPTKPYICDICRKR